MKFIILFVISCISFAVRSDDFAFIKNRANGVIMLTTEPCILNEKFLRVWNNLSTGETAEGCYKIDWNSGMVKVVWSDGTQYTYPIKQFTTVKQIAPGYQR